MLSRWLSGREKDAFGKVDIVHALAERYGLRRYLEFVSITTGHHYREIDLRRFDVCKRLMYRCPPGHRDGLPLDYQSADLDLTAPLAAIRAEVGSFDIMLVDPYHYYDVSLRDLRTAFALLEPGGVMVVHDCLPPNAEIASPTFKPVNWCGETYRAFLDFVLENNDLRYLTVDADYGCGVVRKLPSLPRSAIDRSTGWRRRRRIATWRRAGDSRAAWRVFDANRKILLRLVSPADFTSGRHNLD